MSLVVFAAVCAVFLGLLSLVPYSANQYCYFFDSDPFKLYASKTSYEVVRGTDESEVNLPGCDPVLFYFLSRHGARFPSNADTILMRSKLPRLQNIILKFSKNSELCREDLKALRKWKLPFNPLNRDLAPEGELEQTRIARRFAKRFPNFLRDDDDDDDDVRYDVRYMSGPRIAKSLDSFLTGLWKTRHDLWGKVKLQNDDQLLFFDRDCPKWNRNQNVSSSAMTAAATLVEKHYAHLRKRIARRISAPIISSVDVDVMYNGCRFETAWFPGTKSPWCALFHRSDLELLELTKDIDYFIRYGYQSEINYEQACPIVRDIVRTMESVMDDSVAPSPSPSPSVVIRYSHSGAMVKFLTRLGLFNGSESIFDFDEKRSWRTSFLDPFSSNLCLVLFECRDRQFRILSYLQERLIALPVGCAQPCSAHQFLDYYKPISDSCNVNEICK